MQKFHYLLRCYTIGINYSLMFFLSALRFSNLIRQAKGLIRIIRIIFIEIVINIIKIYIKNIHLITRKSNITRIFIKLEYTFICIQSSVKFFNHFTCNKPIGNKFQCCWRIINSFITNSLNFIIIRTICY